MNETKILIEAIDDNEIAQLANNIDQLAQIIEPYREQLPALAAALDAARNDAAKYLSSTGIWAAVVKALKPGATHAKVLNRIITLQTSILKAFKTYPQVKKLLGANLQPDEALVSQPSAKNAVGMIQSALQPAGVLAAFKGLPYGAKMGKIATEMLGLTDRQFAEIFTKLRELKLPISARDVSDAIKVLQGKKPDPEPAQTQQAQQAQQAASNATSNDTGAAATVEPTAQNTAAAGAGPSANEPAQQTAQQAPPQTPPQAAQQTAPAAAPTPATPAKKQQNVRDNLSIQSWLIKTINQLVDQNGEFFFNELQDAAQRDGIDEEQMDGVLTRQNMITPVNQQTGLYKSNSPNHNKAATGGAAAQPAQQTNTPQEAPVADVGANASFEETILGALERAVAVNPVANRNFFKYADFKNELPEELTKNQKAMESVLNFLKKNNLYKMQDKQTSTLSYNRDAGNKIKASKAAERQPGSSAEGSAEAPGSTSAATSQETGQAQGRPSVHVNDLRSIIGQLKDAENGLGRDENGKKISGGSARGQQMLLKQLRDMLAKKGIKIEENFSLAEQYAAKLRLKEYGAYDDVQEAADQLGLSMSEAIQLLRTQINEDLR